MDSERARLILESGSHGHFDRDPATGETWLSPRFRELLGFESSDEVGLPGTFAAILERMHPEDLPGAREARESGEREGGDYVLLCRLRRRSGDYRWFRVRATVEHGEGGEPERIFGTLTDVHEEIEAGEALRLAEQRLSLAIKAANIGLWDWNVPSGETYFSDTWYTMLGYEVGELPMSLDSWTKICHPDDLEVASKDLDAYFAGETELYVNEQRLRRKDGSWCWIRDVGEIVERDEEGKPLRVVGLHLDVTAFKEVSGRLEMALAAANAGLWDWYVQQDRFVSNDSFHTMLGEPPSGGEHPTSYFMNRVHPEDQERLQSAIDEAFVGDGAADYDVEFRLRCHDGSYSWVRSTGAVIERTPEGLPLRMIGQHLDINKAKQALQQAEAANRTKSAFLANMSHEIRTPMTSILGYAEILRANSDLREDRQQVDHLTGIICDNAQHLLSILDDILDMSKIEAGRMKVERIPMDPSSVLAGVGQLMGPRAEAKGIDLEIAWQSEAPEEIQSDPTRLRQILINLAGNGIKFTEEGGVRILVRCDRSAEELVFEVTDTGIGMDEEQLGRIRDFDAFTQADSSTTRRFGGSGLGLRISVALASMLGGRLEVSSVEGQGSTFTLSVATGSLEEVPFRGLESATRASGAAPDEDEASAAGPGLAGLHLLLAEDVAYNQKLITIHLERAGAKVTVVDDGQQALDAWRVAEGNSFDVILLDMQMPVLDGYSAARQLREGGCKEPIVALTAHAMAGDREQCLAAGCDDYLSKPVDSKALIELCSRLGRASFNKT